MSVKGDFSRDTFDPTRHYHRVMMQQGRNLLDADWNEQQAILLYLMRTAIRDIIGPFGAPCRPDGKIGNDFIIKKDLRGSFTIGWGHYYVDGILCENVPRSVGQAGQEGLPWTRQPDYPLQNMAGDAPVHDGGYLVYLDIWERHITALEDDRIREKALGGPDTATRSRVVWQVKLEEAAPDPSPRTKEGWNEWVSREWDRLVAGWQPWHHGFLRARVVTGGKGSAVAGTGYQGMENRLYRVEIHRGGTPGKVNHPDFKWSRDNGSVVLPITKPIDVDPRTGNTTIFVGNPCRNDGPAISAGDRVEILDDACVLRNEAHPLLKVIDIDTSDGRVTLAGPTRLRPDPGKDHPLIRRWDQVETSGTGLNDNGAVDIVEGTTNDTAWISLEDGIEIQFVAPVEGNTPHLYRTGDYWLIPVRTATRDVEWPSEGLPGRTPIPCPLPPHGVEHHYAPLAILLPDHKDPVDLRRGMNHPCR